MEHARRVLRTWLSSRQPRFIPCDERVLTGLKATTGGRTTDFYRAHLAGTHGMRLATLDEAIAHPAAFVIPN